MPHLSSLRAGANLIDVFKAFPATSTPLVEFHEALLRGPSPFSAAERELIAAFVSGLNRCEYCHGVHTATAERMGIEAGLLPRILQSGRPGSSRASASSSSRATRRRRPSGSPTVAICHCSKR